jgi:hypothetical protein
MMKRLLFALPIFLLPFCSTITAEAQVIVENSLQAVEIVGVETSARVIRLTLKNVSPKNITAIDFATSENNTMTIDSILGAGDILMVSSIDKVFNIDIMPEHPSSKVGILAVVFEDGTGEGVPARLDIIKNIRLAHRDQMRRIVPLWSSLLDTAQTGDQQALSRLLDAILVEVSTLPETRDVKTEIPDRDYNMAQQIGLQGPKQDIVRDVHEIQRLLTKDLPKEGPEHSIRLFKEQYDKILEKLENDIL